MAEPQPAPASQAVLLIEDGPGDVALTRLALARRPNLELFAVSDGVAALAFLRREGPYRAAPWPSVVLLDLNLPGLDGLDVLELIKADPVLRSLVVVVASTSDAATDIARAYELGAAAYLAKSSEFETYAHALGCVMDVWLTCGRAPPRPPAGGRGKTAPGRLRVAAPTTLGEKARSEARAVMLLADGAQASGAADRPTGAEIAHADAGADADAGAGAPASGAGAVDGEQQSAEERAEERAEAERRAASARPVHVLLVEDNLGDQALVAALLSPLVAPDFRVTAVARLEDALVRGGDGDIDVILLDLGLPDSDGLQTFAALQRALPHVPVVVQSGQSDAAVAVEAVQRGAEDYLVKGTLPGEQLGRALVYAIERRQHRREQARLRHAERQARRAAEEAVRARDDFITIAAHELKTPLHTLTMQLDLMVRRAARKSGAPCDPRQAEGIARMQRQVDRLGTLVAHLLDTTRIHAGRLALERTHVDLAVLAAEVLERMEAHCRAQDVTLRFSSSGDATGDWDASRLDQVVVNLVANAVKYGGGGHVDVAVEGRRDPHGAVRLCVRDYGPGIAAADRGRIFERFERAGRPRTNEGLGLGLFIVRQIVDAHRGAITVEPGEGGGTTFTVALP